MSWLPLILFSFFAAHAQNKQPDEWEVYLKPLSLVDPISGTLQPGITKRINNHLAIAFDYGVKFPLMSHYYKNSDRKNYRYSKSSLEVKYIFEKGIDRNKAGGSYFYIGLRGFYFPQHYRLYNSYFIQDDEDFHYDFSDLKRTVWTTDFMIGFHVLNGRFSFTPYLGFGLRLITIKQQPYNLVPAAISYPADWDFSSHIERSNGTFKRPDFPGGFTFGYRLGK